jgi:tyrosine-protein kinase Etk/Wzc
MNSEQNSIILEEGEADSENINEILRKYIFHWPLILLGVIFSIGIAFIYLRYSTPVYQINTSLLIKDEGKSTTSADILSQLDLNGSAKVVENEVEILRSKDLMQKVVNRLHLDVTLQAEGRIKSSDIYESKPVEFLPIQMNAFETNDELQITLLDNDHYVFHSPALGLSIKGQYDVVQKNRFGVYRIKRTLNYKNFVGRNFNLSIQNPAQVANQYLSKLTVGVAGNQQF